MKRVWPELLFCLLCLMSHHYVEAKRQLTPYPSEGILFRMQEDLDGRATERQQEFTQARGRLGSGNGINIAASIEVAASEPNVKGTREKLTQIEESTSDKAVKGAVGEMKALINDFRFARLAQKEKNALHTKLFEDEETEELVENTRQTHFYIPRELETRNVFEEFIKHKLQSGSSAERQYYQQFIKIVHGATEYKVDDFIASLVKKRTRAFTNMFDQTLLKEGHSDIITFLPWEYIGRDDWEGAHWQTRYKMWKAWFDETGYPGFKAKYNMEENVKNNPQLFHHFTIWNYLSYDEMQLAALMIAAGPATFHSNCGYKYWDRKYKEGEFVKQGYIVGAVGPRFEKPGYMDSAMLLPPNPASDPNAAKLRQIIYGVRELPDDWIEFETEGKASKFVSRKLFRQRLKISYGAYLDFVHKTMSEPKNKGKTAYVVVLGLGGGAWAIHWQQMMYYWPAIRELITERSEYQTTIDTLHFVGFPKEFIDDDKAQKAFPAKDRLESIIITSAAMSGTTATTTKDGNTVRFTIYPWDCNSLPGNEFWLPLSSSWPAYKDGAQSPTLTAILELSGDPAAACCSDIIYTQNWLVNENLAQPGDAQYLLDPDDMKAALRVNMRKHHQYAAQNEKRYDPHSYRGRYRRRLSAKDEEETPSPLVSASYRSVSHWALFVSTAVLAISTLIISFYMVFIR